MPAAWQFGANSLAGVTYTDRTGAGEFIRVLSADSPCVSADRASNVRFWLKEIN
jgi:hypothetical protein